MISRDGFKVAMTTTGSVTPGFEELRKPYVYGGDKPLEATPEHRLSGAEALMARRAGRVTRFGEILRELGTPDPWTAPDASVIEAGRQLGVGEKTAKGYRADLRKRQPREVCDA